MCEGAYWLLLSHQNRPLSPDVPVTLHVQADTDGEGPLGGVRRLSGAAPPEKEAQRELLPDKRPHSWLDAPTS